MPPLHLRVHTIVSDEGGILCLYCANGSASCDTVPQTWQGTNRASGPYAREKLAPGSQLRRRFK